VITYARELWWRVSRERVRSLAMNDYYSAAVCRRGHVETAILEDALGDTPAKCATCGAPILTACASCGAPIRGMVVGVVGYGWKPSDFCDNCGTPQPWASRQARLYELENILEESDALSDADRLTLREQLEALREHPDADEAEQVERWQRIKRIAPSLMGTGRQIFVSVASATIQRQLGV
jgi:hypothetical protein